MSKIPRAVLWQDVAHSKLIEMHALAREKIVQLSLGNDLLQMEIEHLKAKHKRWKRTFIVNALIITSGTLNVWIGTGNLNLACAALCLLILVDQIAMKDT